MITSVSLKSILTMSPFITKGYLLVGGVGGSLVLMAYLEKKGLRINEGVMKVILVGGLITAGIIFVLTNPLLP